MPKSTSQSARRRTQAQRKKTSEDEPVVVQDNEEQEAEIRALRRENDESNARIRITLDFGVLTVIILTTLHPLRHAPSLPLFLVSLSQALLLVCSISPDFFPLLDPIQAYHHYALGAQLFLFLSSWFLLQSTGAPAGNMIWYALPELVAGAVEIYRRGEREAESRLAHLEELRYDLKGA